MDAAESRVSSVQASRMMHRAIEVIAGWCGAVWGSRTGSSVRQMQVLETLALGPKKQLVLVSCNGEHYLVGTGADSVQTIVRVGCGERS